MTELNLQTGARRGDLLKLTWKSVHQDYVEFLETKECKHREGEVSLSSRAERDSRLAPIPWRRPGTRSSSSPDVKRKTMVSRMRREWVRALTASGVSAKIRYHDMRHTVGTRLLRDGMDPENRSGDTRPRLCSRPPSDTLHSNLSASSSRLRSKKLSGYGRRLPSAPETPVHQKHP